MKKLLLLLIILLIINKLQAQQKIIPEKRIYKTTDGKIYVNKALPLYVKISESPSKTAEHKLIKNNKKFLPFYLKKEGLNLFYSKWAVDTITKKTIYPRQNVYFEVYADGIPPKTYIHNSETSYKKNDTIIFGKGLKIWLTAYDKTSGIAHTYISVNNKDFEEYTADTLAFDQEGYYTIKFYSTDLVGNCESTNTVSFFVDTTKPLTNLVIYGKHAGNILSSDAKVVLQPKDAFVSTPKTLYTLDNQKQKIYTTPISVRNIPEGLHMLRYYSIDKVKNKEESKTYEFYIDKTPPMVMSEIVGDYVIINGKAYTSSNSEVHLSAIDNKAGVKDIYYSFDLKNWHKYTKPFPVPQNTTKLNLYFYAEDNVGNIGKAQIDDQINSSNSNFATIDVLPPKINYSITGQKYLRSDTIFISPKAKITFTAIDNASGVKETEYQIDNLSPVNNQHSFSIETPGKHKIIFTATDKVNNIQTKDLILFVDTIAPKLNVTFSSRPLQKNIYPKNSKIYLSANDFHTDVQTILYKINNSTFRTYTSPIKISKTGKYTLKVKSVDVLGNQKITELNFEIK